jgi:hypothetical protein
MDDPVEQSRPKRVQCLTCKERHAVTDEGALIEHNISESQISDDWQYSTIVTQRCPGSGAKVSLWKRVGLR